MRSQTFALPIDAMSLLLMMQMHASTVNMFFFKKKTHTHNSSCALSRRVEGDRFHSVHTRYAC